MASKQLKDYEVIFYHKPRKRHIAQSYVIRDAPTAKVAKARFKRRWAGGRGIGKKRDIKDYTIVSVKVR